jgi:hypothetical protein
MQPSFKTTPFIIIENTRPPVCASCEFVFGFAWARHCMRKDESGFLRVLDELCELWVRVALSRGEGPLPKPGEEHRWLLDEIRSGIRMGTDLGWRSEEVLNHIIAVGKKHGITM